MTKTDLNRKGLKTIYKTIIVALLCTLSSYAQSIDKLLIDLPADILPSLSKQQKIEMIEYAKSNRGDSIKNKFGGFSNIENFDSVNQLISIRTSPVSITEIKVISTNKKQIIAVINTIEKPIKTSNIKFYNFSWQPITTGFSLPRTDEWLNMSLIHEKEIDKDWVLTLFDYKFISLSFSTDLTIIATNNALDYLSNEDKKTIAPLITDKTVVIQVPTN